LIFKHQHPLTKQNKKEKAAVKEEIATALYDIEMNDENETILENVDVQNPDAIIMSKGEKKKRLGKIKRKDDKIKSNSSSIDYQIQENIMLEDVGNTKTDSMTKNHRVVDVAIMEENQRYTETMNNIIADIIPIVGYAEEPLLPLIEACAPLVDIIYNLLFYAQMALEETPEEPPDGLTIDESASIRLYTIEWSGSHRSLYSMLNRTLKKADRQDLRPYFKYMKLLLTALVKLPCIPPSTIWRGVTKNMSAEFPPDTRVTWWAFSSCTSELTVLENNMYLGNVGDRTLFSVEAINGRTVCAHSHFHTENEILLLPGTQMIVQSQLSPAPDLHIIHMKQVKPDEMLLEPPFEGNLNSLIIYFKL
jgi:hypothetical protein